MSTTSRMLSGSKSKAVPAAVMLIGGLELAAAAWDGRCFLRLSEIFGGSLWSLQSWTVLMPVLMTIAAIYGGVGLMRMRRDSWMVWMVRHAWLSGLYLLSIPGLVWGSLFVPAYSVVLAWRAMIIIFSLIAGFYLYAVRDQFNQ